MTTPNTPATPPPYYHDDEISLVDLTRILIKRWKTIVIVFFVVVFGALGYALMQERTYNYVSLYHVAEQGTSSALEAPNSVIAKINNLYLGPITRGLHESANLERLPFEVTANNPDDTLLVRLVSETAEDNVDLVVQMHEQLLNRMVEDQESLLERNRERLEQQLEAAQRALEAAEQGGSSGDMLATQLGRVTDLEARLAQLNEGQIVQVAVQSLQPTGTGRKLIVAVGIVLGGMLALMAAFMSHFAGLVCASMREEKET